MLLLVVILALAVLLTRRPKTEEAPQLVVVAVASQDIQPYSFISPNQVALGSAKISASAAAAYYENTDDVIGRMTTRFIRAGQQISREDATSAERVRYVEDMRLEVVSFPAVFSEMVAGQVRAGHRINIYGYRTSTGQDHPGELVLVTGNVWVVDVRTASGEEVKTGSDASQDTQGGLLNVSGVGTMAQPASVVTVAASPEIVQTIIYNLGSKGYSAWVTLAPAADSVKLVAILPTAVPTPTPRPSGAEAFANVEGSIYMSYQQDGPRTDVFPNNTSLVWAVVTLQYAPPDPMPIRITVRDTNQNPFFESAFLFPKPGLKSYLIQPTSASKFAPNAQYATTLYAGGKSFSVEWKTSGEARLPATGGEN